MHDSKPGEDIKYFGYFHDESSEYPWISCNRSIKVLMLDVVNPLSFVKFTLHLRQQFSEWFSTDLIDQPKIMFFFDLVDQPSDWPDTRKFIGIDAIASLVVTIFVAITSIFQLHRKQSTQSFNLNFGWTIKSTSFWFWKLLERHLLTVIFWFCKPN